MSCFVNAEATSLQHLIHDLTLDVPGSDLLAENYLQRSAREFFERSARWLVRVPIEAVQTTQIEIANHDVLKVMQVRMADGEYIRERLIATQIDDNPRFINSTPDVLEFTFEPDQASEAIVAITLDPDNIQVDKALLRRYRTAILTGAKSMLLMIGGKEFTDQNRASMETQKFDNSILSAFADANRFIGFDRQYYGEQTYYASDIPTVSRLMGDIDPAIESLEHDLDYAKSQISDQTHQLNVLNGKINELYQELQKQADAANQSNEVDQTYDSGTYEEMLASPDNIKLFGVINSGSNNGLWHRQSTGWEKVEAGTTTGTSTSIFGEGSLVNMLASTDKFLWYCTDINENAGFWKKVNGSWRKD